VKLTFLGTRGYHDVRTPRHSMHTSLLVTSEERQIMIDCGEDWLGKVIEVNPDAIVVTHAHPDHADGLRNGAPCPVYATSESWEVMDGFDMYQTLSTSTNVRMLSQELTSTLATVQPLARG